MEAVALFPGQGAQYPGMGQSIYENSESARQIFEQASEICGHSISDLCFHGTKEELSRTVNSQIAIFTGSMSLAPISQVRATGALGSLLVLHPANSAITQNNNPARKFQNSHATHVLS